MREESQRARERGKEERERERWRRLGDGGGGGWRARERGEREERLGEGQGEVGEPCQSAACTPRNQWRCRGRRVYLEEIERGESDVLEGVLLMLLWMLSQ